MTGNACDFEGRPLIPPQSCVACDRAEASEGSWFCPDCDELWSCSEDCDCLVAGPASEARAE